MPGSVVVGVAHLRRCAEFYAGRLRWPIFPLHPIGRDGRCGGCGGEQCAGKHPIPSHWERSLASPQACASLWRDELGQRGIGLVCGPRSGVWVLDVDRPETLAALEGEHGRLPETWRSRTGSGGEHVFFRALDDEVRNSVGQIAPGLDVRGEGGYVVLPPSRHRSGSVYEWINVPSRQTPLADPPQWVLTLALTRPASTRRDRLGPERLKMIGGGKRHDALVQFCGLLRSCGLGEEAIVECGFSLLRHHAVKDPPMDMEQAERDMRDVARRYSPTAPDSNDG